MTSPPGEWPLLFGAETYSTYGPLYRFLKPSISIDSTSYYPSIKFLVFLLYGVAFILYSRSISLIGMTLLVGFLCVFRFPFYHNFPIVAWMMAVAYLHAQRRTQIFIEVTAVVLISVLASYKFSWSLTCSMQLIFTVFLFNKSAEKSLWYSLKFSLGLLFGILSLYWISCGGDGDIFAYLRYAWLDMTSYNEIALEHQSRKWPMIMLYPLFVFFVICVSFFIKGLNKKIILSMLPIVIFLFKYSWSRSDYDNARMFICYVPYLAFILYLCYCQSRKANFIFIPFVLVSVIASSTIMSKATYPLFFTSHRTDFPVDKEEFRLYKEESCRAFDKYLDGFQWLKKDVQGRKLLSLPSQMYLSLLGEERISLPSHQHHYRKFDDYATDKDIDYLNQQEELPYVLIDNALIDHQSPQSFIPKFYLNLFQSYQVVRSQDSYALLKPLSTKYHQELISLKKIELFGGKAQVDFDIEGGQMICLRAPKILHWFYGVRKGLLKGDKLKFILYAKGHTIHYSYALSLFEKGVYFAPLLPLMHNTSEKIPCHIKFLGVESEDYPYDFSHYLKSISNKADLEVLIVR
ncbi:MAG: hypothetical protein HQL32_03970 [Planctomycetes bacterium]|nr:hypothetical protein [Planctomycetota bacterium]